MKFQRLRNSLWRNTGLRTLHILSLVFSSVLDPAVENLPAGWCLLLTAATRQPPSRPRAFCTSAPDKLPPDHVAVFASWEPRQDSRDALPVLPHGRVPIHVPPRQPRHSYHQPVTATPSFNLVSHVYLATGPLPVSPTDLMLHEWEA